MQLDQVLQEVKSQLDNAWDNQHTMKWEHQVLTKLENPRSIKEALNSHTILDPLFIS